MKTYKVLEIKQSVFENNDRQAELLREELKKGDIFIKSYVITWFRKNNNSFKNS